MNPIPKTEYVKHRLQRAQDTLAEARMLVDGGRKNSQHVSKRKNLYRNRQYAYQSQD